MNNQNDKKKVFVALSGGVDSSVSAALLKQATPNNFEKLFGRPTPKGFRGYDVTGVFIKVWHPEFLPCTWKEERRDAMRVCAHLGISFLTFDLEKEYKKEVVDYMVHEYKTGRTPNPDVMCNKYVKFGEFFKQSMKMGADYIATGHYARVKFNEKSGTYHLLKGIDSNKDQSYFLWTLTQDVLKRTLFPVGQYAKPQVRKLAEKFGLATANKKDSQGLCFIGKLDMKDFLKGFINEKEGVVLTQEKEVIGVHNGAAFYTIGQRHGFTLTKQNPEMSPYYVIDKETKGNTITVSPIVTIQNKDTVKLENTNWIGDSPQETNIYEARTRYRQKLSLSEVSNTSGNHTMITFSNALPLSPPGQSLVLYDNERCMGGGIIM
ncbi:tRNA 2-thiouridine(34) synthase MnmA [Patescibacteria group bacterium]|nr:tRNA 2-thiouridine(34) synthase MnmA [Patescibacteria group bacterium]